jgi:hypothetical protein
MSEKCYKKYRKIFTRRRFYFLPEKSLEEHSGHRPETPQYMAAKRRQAP